MALESKIHFPHRESINDFKKLTLEHNKSNFDPNIEIFFNNDNFHATQKFTLSSWNNPLKKSVEIRGKFISENNSFFLDYKSSFTLTQTGSLVVIIGMWVFFTYSFFTSNDYGFIGGIIAAPIAFTVIYLWGRHQQKELEECLFKMSKKVRGK